MKKLFGESAEPLSKNKNQSSLSNPMLATLNNSVDQLPIIGLNTARSLEIDSLDGMGNQSDFTKQGGGFNSARDLNTSDMNKYGHRSMYIMN